MFENVDQPERRSHVLRLRKAAAEPRLSEPRKRGPGVEGTGKPPAARAAGLAGCGPERHGGSGACWIWGPVASRASVCLFVISYLAGCDGGGRGEQGRGGGGGSR